jgi:hypothetical protein
MSEIEQPQPADPFTEIVEPVLPEFPEIGEIETFEAARDGAVEGAAAAVHYLVLVESGVPGGAAARLTRDYVENRAWLRGLAE